MWGFWENLALIISTVVGMTTVVGLIASYSAKTTAAITRLDTTIGNLEKTLERIQDDQHNDQLDVLRRMSAADEEMAAFETRLTWLERDHGRIHKND